MTNHSPIVEVHPSSVGEVLPLKLNLGGRTTNIPGFKTVDLYGGDNVDIAADLSDLNMIETGSVSELYASHCLEHFCHLRTVDVLKEWRRVMKKGCKAYIAVPDFEAVVNIYKRDGLTDWMRNFLFGDQIYDKAFHYTGFDFQVLAKLLVKAGWSDVKRILDMPYNLGDCSHLRYSNGNDRVSLNVEAIA